MLLALCTNSDPAMASMEFNGGNKGEIKKFNNVLEM